MRFHCGDPLRDTDVAAADADAADVFAAVLGLSEALNYCNAITWIH